MAAHPVRDLLALGCADTLRVARFKPGRRDAVTPCAMHRRDTAARRVASARSSCASSRERPFLIWQHAGRPRPRTPPRAGRRRGCRRVRGAVLRANRPPRRRRRPARGGLERRAAAALHTQGAAGLLHTFPVWRPPEHLSPIWLQAAEAGPAAGKTATGARDAATAAAIAAAEAASRGGAKWEAPARPCCPSRARLAPKRTACAEHPAVAVTARLQRQLTDMARDWYRRDISFPRDRHAPLPGCSSV